MLLISLITFSNLQAQKKVKHFKVEKTLNLSAAKVWAVVGEDYGGIFNSHPKIINSEYTKGSLKSEEGAERMCYFNKNGSKYLHEKMVNYSPKNMSFTNTIKKTGKFPVNPEYTKAIYKVTDLGGGKSKISIDMTYRTKPAMMGGMMKGAFINLMKDYFIAVEHHVKTGENVTKSNFKKIKKQYSSRAVVSK